MPWFQTCQECFLLVFLAFKKWPVFVSCDYLIFVSYFNKFISTLFFLVLSLAMHFCAFFTLMLKALIFSYLSLLVYSFNSVDGFISTTLTVFHRFYYIIFSHLILWYFPISILWNNSSLQVHFKISKCEYLGNYLVLICSNFNDLWIGNVVSSNFGGGIEICFVT